MASTARSITALIHQAFDECSTVEELQYVAEVTSQLYQGHQQLIQSMLRDRLISPLPQPMHRLRRPTIN